MENHSVRFSIHDSDVKALGYPNWEKYKGGDGRSWGK